MFIFMTIQNYFRLNLNCLHLRFSYTAARTVIIAHIETFNYILHSSADDMSSPELHTVSFV